MTDRVNFKLAYGGQKHRFASTFVDDELFRAVKAKVQSIVGRDDYEMFWNDGDSDVVLETAADLFAAIDCAKCTREDTTKPPCVRLFVVSASELESHAVPTAAAAATAVETSAAREQLQAEELLGAAAVALPSTVNITTTTMVPQAVQEFLEQLERGLLDDVQLDAINGSSSECEGVEPERTPAHVEVEALLQLAVASKPARWRECGHSVYEMASLLLRDWIERTIKGSSEATPITLAALYIIARAAGENSANMQRVVDELLAAKTNEEVTEAVKEEAMAPWAGWITQTAAVIFQAGLMSIYYESIGGPLVVPGAQPLRNTAEDTEMLVEMMIKAKEDRQEADDEELWEDEDGDEGDDVSLNGEEDNWYELEEISEQQDAAMEEAFKYKLYPSPVERQRLAAEHSMSVDQVRLWFIDRRDQWRSALRQDNPDSTKHIRILEMENAEGLRVMKEELKDLIPEETAVLEEAFLRCPFEDAVTKEELATELRLSEYQIKIWFLNRRCSRRHGAGGGGGLRELLKMVMADRPPATGKEAEYREAMLALIDREQDELEMARQMVALGQQFGLCDSGESIFDAKAPAPSADVVAQQTEESLTDSEKEWDKLDERTAEVVEQEWDDEQDEEDCDDSIFGEYETSTEESPQQVRIATPEQAVVLEKTFALKLYPSYAERRQLAEQLDLTIKQVRRWFVNRRDVWRGELKAKNVASSKHIRSLEIESSAELQSMYAALKQLTPEQEEVLEENFQYSAYEDASMKEQLALELKLSEYQIKLWFSKRRLQHQKECAPQMEKLKAEFAFEFEQKKEIDCLPEGAAKNAAILSLMTSFAQKVQVLQKEGRDFCWRDMGRPSAEADAAANDHIEQPQQTAATPSVDEATENSVTDSEKDWDKMEPSDKEEEVLYRLSGDVQKRIVLEVDLFNRLRKEFELELNCSYVEWDAAIGIVQTAMNLSAILGDMTQFTVGRGTYKSKDSVIRAARVVYQLGQRLSGMVREIAEKKTASLCSADRKLNEMKMELVDHLTKLELFCSQLSYCSNVKSEGFESTLSLTLTAGNILTTVAGAVKSLHILCTNEFASASDIEQDWDRVYGEEEKTKTEKNASKAMDNSSKTQELLPVIEKEAKKEVAACEVKTANEQSTKDIVMEEDEDDFDHELDYEDEDYSISDLSLYDEETKEVASCEAKTTNAQSTQEIIMVEEEDDFDIDEYLEDSISDLSLYDEEADDDECDLEQQIGAYLEESNEEARLRTLAKLALDDRQQQLNVEKQLATPPNEEKKENLTTMPVQTAVRKHPPAEPDVLLQMALEQKKEREMAAAAAAAKGAVASQGEAAPLDDENTEKDSADEDAHNELNHSDVDAEKVQKQATAAKDSAAKERELKIREKALAIKEEAFDRRVAEWAVLMAEAESRMEKMEGRCAAIDSGKEEKVAEMEARLGKMEEEMNQTTTAATENGAELPQEQSGKMNCNLCGDRLKENHFVQCHTQEAHMFCFPCTRETMNQQEMRCPSGEKCPLKGATEPWTFDLGEVLAIYDHEKFEALKQMQA